MIPPARIVENAVTELAHGEIARHLAYVADDVVVQFNENPPISGKVPYERALRQVRNGEVIVSFRIAGEAADPGGGVTIRVDQVQQLVQGNQPGQSPTLRETLKNSYTVRENVIVKIKMALLGGPNRVYRYP